MSFDYHVIVDLEATCCNDDSFPRDEMEIIEIGAVMVQGNTLEIVSEFQSFIQPVRHHPQLTDFCKELTSISQADVDSAPGFKEAIQKFQTWTSSFANFDFCSWGNYDRNQLEQDCQFHQVPSPILAPHRNLKQEFSTFLGVNKVYGMSKALSTIGIKLEGTTSPWA
jgi:inhibitor of KinA sporulation pathway (predicted exonuclease)